MLHSSSASPISRRALAPGLRRKPEPGANALRLISKRNHRDIRSGLTLLELVIVMVILAALTGIAVRAIEPVADQARYESTLKLAENIERAFLSADRNVDGSVSYSGFVADMGRLPIADGSNPEFQLSELWAAPAGAPSYSVAIFQDGEFDTDPSIADTQPLTVPVAGGWRGPYLLMPPGPQKLRDGFGNSFLLTISDEGEIVEVISEGANGINVDLPGGPWSSARFRSSIAVSVLNNDGTPAELKSGETVHVRIYGPDDNPLSVTPGSRVVLGMDEFTNAGGTTVNVNQQFTFSNVEFTYGRRTIVAVITTGSDPYIVESQSSPKQVTIGGGSNLFQVYLNAP